MPTGAQAHTCAHMRNAQTFTRAVSCARLTSLRRPRHATKLKSRLCCKARSQGTTCSVVRATMYVHLTDMPMCSSSWTPRRMECFFKHIYALKWRGASRGIPWPEPRSVIRPDKCFQPSCFHCIPSDVSSASRDDVLEPETHRRPRRVRCGSLPQPRPPSLHPSLRPSLRLSPLSTPPPRPPPGFHPTLLVLNVKGTVKSTYPSLTKQPWPSALFRLRGHVGSKPLRQQLPCSRMPTGAQMRTHTRICGTHNFHPWCVLRLLDLAVKTSLCNETAV